MCARAAARYSGQEDALDYLAYSELVTRWSKVAAVREYGRVVEAGREYPLYCLEAVAPGQPVLVVTAGFHGEEPGGPLTLARRFDEVAAHAKARGVGLRVYPCLNPSGFEAGHRYNASGERPNNDFLRYVSPTGELREEVAAGEPFASWHTYDGGPKETRALRADLLRFEAPRAALDLHQDAWVKRPCMYAYYFTERERHVAVFKRCARFAKVGVNVAVHDASRTDAAGLIIHYDGSVSDWFFRRGARHVAVLETSTRLTQDACDGINLEWVRSYVDFAAEP